MMKFFGTATENWYPEDGGPTSIVKAGDTALPFAGAYSPAPTIYTLGPARSA